MKPRVFQAPLGFHGFHLVFTVLAGRRRFLGVGQPLSECRRQTAGMKLTNMIPNMLRQDKIVAYFGQARLVRRLDAKFELRGGSPEDHSVAQEWISMFLHEAVLVGTTQRQLTRPAAAAKRRSEVGANPYFRS
jgi:hypothetical protein